jgi:hypothetical protein
METGGEVLGFNDAQNVTLFHDQELFTIDFDLGAGPLAEQHFVTGFDVQCDAFTGITQDTIADSDYFTFLRLLSCRIRDDDPTGSFGGFFNAPNEDAVM